MKRLCLGGSFNPIHNGHLICAESAAKSGPYDGVVLIPSAQPPHKSASADLAPAKDRLAMARLAAETMPNFSVDDLELQRAGPSFTIDTARELRRRGWDEVHWLIGADMLNTLPKWHNPAALLREVNFVILARPGFEFDWASLPGEFQFLRNNVVPAPLIGISASDIRRRVRDGRSIKGMTPESVVDYIMTQKLYC